eukprot:COSAG04_NODE_103_length_26181_cov_19.804616_9_plen_265_part_00
MIGSAHPPPSPHRAPRPSDAPQSSGRLSPGARVRCPPSPRRSPIDIEDPRSAALRSSSFATDAATSPSSSNSSIVSPAAPPPQRPHPRRLSPTQRPQPLPSARQPALPIDLQPAQRHGTPVEPRRKRSPREGSALAVLARRSEDWLAHRRSPDNLPGRDAHPHVPQDGTHSPSVAERGARSTPASAGGVECGVLCSEEDPLLVCSREECAGVVAERPTPDRQRQANKDAHAALRAGNWERAREIVTRAAGSSPPPAEMRIPLVE